VLGTLEVMRSPDGAPVAIIPMEQRVERMLGPVRLLGYDAYRKYFAHAPETPLAPGDLLHVTFYWQAPTPLPTDWSPDLTFTLHLGTQRLQAPLAGGAYPTGQWQAGEVVRGEFDLLYEGTGQQPVLTVAGVQQRLIPVPR